MTRKWIMIVILIIFITYSAKATETIFWYLPHPDDETLGMASSIHQSVLDGNDNYFIYFSKGTNSLARFALTSPTGEIYQLTEEEFGEARVAETLASLKILGVEADQVIFLNYNDGNIPQAEVEATIRLLANLFPGSIHRTVHWLDPHPDHQAVAKALGKVAHEDDLDLIAEFYHVYIQRSNAPIEHLNKRYVQHHHIRNQALEEFGKWDPDNNRYGIGMASTADLFEAVSNNYYEYVDSISDFPDQSQLKLTSHLIVSNLDFRYKLIANESFAIINALDFATSNYYLGFDYRLKSDLPLVELAIEAGYHWGYHQPTIAISTTVVRHFVVSLQHIFKTQTRLGVGISTQLF